MMNEHKYKKLYKVLADGIEENHWLPGDKLPSIRQLAQDHQLSKISVQHALRELEKEQLVIARAKSGYYVNDPSTSRAGKSGVDEKSPSAITLPDIFYTVMSRGAAFDLYPSAPIKDTNNYLVTLNRMISKRMRHHPETAAYCYTSPGGDTALREQISAHYRRVSVDVDPQNICITAGCQHSLMLSIVATCSPGDIVVIESPGFYGIALLCQQLDLKVIELDVSSTTGASPDELAVLFEKWDVKACILCPNYATPSGALIPSENKKKIVELAQHFNVTLIEDDIYGDLGFYAREEPLKAYDDSGNVMLCGSFSKSLSRDLRIGWIINEKRQGEILKLKLTSILASSNSVQRGVADFLAEGHYKRHLVNMRSMLKRNRDQLVHLLRDEWSFPVKYTVPDGGLCLWVELPKRIDAGQVYKQLLQQDIIITPGLLFSVGAKFTNHIRLSFLHIHEDERLRAFRQLGQVIEKQIER